MNESPLKSVLRLAVEQNASDILIKQDCNVLLKINDRLVSCNFKPNAQFMEKSLDFMLLSEEMRKRYNGTGDMDLSYKEDEVGRFRVNIHKQRGTPAISIRYVKSQVRTFSQLNLPNQIEKITKSKRGIIIITGTTGSGKSTTLASMINYINQHSDKHIVTVEDPIEYEFVDDKSFIEQRELGLDTISFDSAFIHALRQNPDVIMVGEMRSKDSFDCALKSADTGHLVLTTLHTSNATQSVNRILDFYNANEHHSIRKALATNLTAIISQRLIAKADGSGLVPAVEIMINTPVIHGILSEGNLDKLAAAVESNKDEGMQSFNQSVVELVNKGIITEEDALANATNVEALKMNLKGIFLKTESSILDK